MAPKTPVTADQLSELADVTFRKGSDFWGNHGHGDRIEEDGRKSVYPTIKNVDWRTLIPDPGTSGEKKG